jgi:predicted lactoylglutathione lyase
MTGIASIAIEADDATAAEAFYKEAFDLGDTLSVRESQESTSGFRGFTVSLVVAQPSTVDALVRSALDAGANEVKPVSKSFWGYGGSIQAPDGTLWTIASSSKKDTGPATREVDDVVLLLGVEDVKATKAFYVERGLAVGKSFGSKYVEFDAPGAAVKLALYSRKAAAKNAGVDPEGSGSHRLVIVGDSGIFTDPDGFVWEGKTG